MLLAKCSSARDEAAWGVTSAGLSKTPPMGEEPNDDVSSAKSLTW